MKEINSGSDLFVWSVTYTEDGGSSWRTGTFGDMDGARAFLREAAGRNEGNGGFSFYAERKMLVNAFALMDLDATEMDVELVFNGRLVSLRDL